MSTRILELLALLKSKVDARGVIVDEAFRTRVLVANEDAGMTGANPILIRFGRKSTESEVRELDDYVHARFGTGLPQDFLTFLRHSDGLKVRELDEGSQVPTTPFDTPESFVDGCILSHRTLLDWLERHQAEVRNPGQRPNSLTPPWVPVYDLQEVGVHAFDFRDGKRTIVDVDSELLWRTELDFPLLAPTFSDWFERLVEVGFAPFDVAR